MDAGDDHRKELYKLAASNGKEGRLMFVTREYEGKLELVFNNSPFAYCKISKLLPEGERGKGTVYRSKEMSISAGRLLLTVGKGEVYLVSFFNK